MKKPKKIEFIGNSLEKLKAFPVAARREAGFQLERLQYGGEPADWKPMTTIGQGVREIRVRDASGAFRIIYVAKFLDAVYVLHCFQKKTQQTTKADLDLAEARFKELLSKVKK
jgi:phage-related protein